MRALVLLFVLPALLQAQSLGFEVPAGFAVTQYADDALASDIYSLAIDSKGRVVVSSKNSVKILVDTDGDGKADQAIPFSKLPASGAHGMTFDGNDMIAAGDLGVRRYIDRDGDGICDDVQLLFPTAKDSEHGANAIHRGPDGWFYLITGNDAGITDRHANTPTSPIKKPSMGALVRFSADGTKIEVLADGFRNPYGLGFNAQGQAFTVDADGERVHHLPYYAPTRLFDIAQARHHGWVNAGWQGGWSRSGYFPDSVERLVEIGRGSPTGLAVYRHQAFPAKYHGGVFHVCWTFGKVYFMPLKRQGATYASEVTEFMKTTGDVGFAPTGLAVGPEGDLFVSIGGRGTRGGVFRIRYTGKDNRVEPDPLALPVVEVLNAPEPLAAWSRARWLPIAKKLGKSAFEKELLREGNSDAERMRAVEILTDLFGGIDPSLAHKLKSPTTPPEVLARVAWSLSVSSDEFSAVCYLGELTGHVHPVVQRAAWEGLQRYPPSKFLEPNWTHGLGSEDRRIRWAALKVAQAMGPKRFKTLVAGLPDSDELRLASLWTEVETNPQKVYHACEYLLARGQNPMLQLEAVRLLQLSLGDVASGNADKSRDGYVARAADAIPAKDRSDFASRLKFASKYHVDLEIARLAGMLGEDAPTILKEYGPDTDAEIHYLLCLARIPGVRSAVLTEKTAKMVHSIHELLTKKKAKPADQVPGILEAMYDELQRKDPKLPDELLKVKGFGIPGQELFIARFPPKERSAGVKLLLGKIASLDEDAKAEAWSPDLVKLVAELPDAESLPILRKQFRDARLTDSIALVLAKKKHADDRPLFLEALGSSQPKVVQAAAETLVAFKESEAKPADLAQAVKALRRFPAKDQEPVRKALADLLAAWTTQKLEPHHEPWTAWLTKTHPEAAKSLVGFAGANPEAWKNRLGKIDWASADLKRGEAVYHKRSCFRCHGEARRLGPDLAGVGQRFSLEDLFTAIVDPSKDVAPAFRSTTVMTANGKAHNGIVIYSSQEVTLLQTTPDTTVRIPRSEVQLIQASPISFMPVGLLDDAKDQELADLAAYLKTLKAK